MSLVTADISVSLDLVAAGHDQSLEHPFGPVVGDRLHPWMFEHGDDSPDEIAGILRARAYVMGRHMFGPDRGAWDLRWQGWWGSEPPYHAPAFVLCSRPREALTMAGGTTFHFVTEGIETALERARDAAGEGDVAIAGGPSTLNAYLGAGLVDELRLHVVPFTVGDGLRVFDGVEDLAMVPASSRTTPHVTHLVYRRTSP
ncbi:dihydrofolate reductase family protein [Pengzhenrongella frigida]|uniref:Dihydrofolate reductase n=1 Tax=Pengzhenrongella frigida TaxID=1259133 RepID=A0A4Q5N456_9MICO|nr:dihydrofolate reductase family protein [Cellulomonas sp. HLT2-17]RYV51427.1 dihydrofolate reductase [Cellulomonas sp. HLT2-17]